MEFIKLTVCLTLMMALMLFTTATTMGGKMYFQGSTELEELNRDERPGNGRGHRNHRGRGRGHNKHIVVQEFEEGLPGEYPIRGPPQAPLILPPGRGVGLEKNKFATTQGINPEQQYTANNLPAAIPAVQQPQNNPYASNPFLYNIQTSNVIPTNKQNIAVSQGITNQLPTSDKPITTTPSYANPRRSDLFYGSNLLEEDAQLVAKSNDTSEISFIDRGLFDTAPHCQDGYILVNNKCRLAV